MPNPDSPLGRYYPTAAAVQAVRNELGISMQDAKRHLMRKALARACDEAKTFEELQPIVRALISCAPL